MSKRFSFSCVEQMVLNVNYRGFRNFRVEIFDRDSGGHYQDDEVAFLVPGELFDVLYDAIDGYESDVPMSVYGGQELVEGFIEERKGATLSDTERGKTE